MKTKTLLSLFVIIVIFLHGCKKTDQKQEDVTVVSTEKDTAKILELIRTANAYTNNFPDSVTYHAMEALKLSENINYNRGIALGNYYLGVAEWAKGNYPESIIYQNKTLDLAKSKQLKALALRDISLSLIYLDRTDEAREYLDKSIEILKSLDDKFGLTLAYINYGMIEGRKENYLLALGHYQEALKLSEETNSLTNKSLILNNLGVINSKLEMSSLALENYQQAYDIVKNSGDLKLRALYLSNIANIQIDLKNYDEALQLIDSGLMLTEESEDKRSRVFLLSNKGEAFLGLKKYDLAIEYLKQSLKLSTETGVNENILDVQISIGKAYYELDNFDKSLTYLKKVLEIAIAENNKEIIKEVGEIMGKVYSTKADFEKAFQYTKLSNEMADSLSKSKIIKQFTQMEMQFDFDKEVYEKELAQQKTNLENKQKLERQRFLLYVFILGFIVILFFVLLLYRNYKIIRKLNARLEDSYNKTKEQNQLIEKKNRDLESLNNTKDKIFSIIAHDLNSPFNTILGFTEMLSSKYDSLDEAKRKHYLKQIYQSSKNAYNLLKNLLIWARSQKGNIELEPEPTELSTFIKSSIEPYMAGAKEKKLKVVMEIPEIKLYLDIFTIRSTLANLFNNAIKFTQNGGQISVSAFKRSSNIEIKISDNGVGISEERLKSLFKIGKNQSTMGTNKEKGTGLGLIICKEFVKKNEGKLKVESEIGKGSTFTIVLPLKSA